MHRKLLLGLLSPCLGVVAMLAPQPAWAQTQKNPWVSSTEIQWADAGTLGPGTSTKVLLTKENGFLDNLVRAEFLLKIEPGGSYATTDTPKEDLAFYVIGGQAHFTLADQQVDAKPGDAFGVPAGTKHSIANNGKEPFEVVVFAAPLLAPNPTAKPVWGRADDMKWEVNATHGPGCELKMILRGGFSTVIRGLWIIRVNGFGINIVHSGAEHQLFYVFEAPEPSKTPRDSRTEAGRLIVGNTVMQTRVGDAFYAGGAPKLVEHGMFNESKDKPMTYVAIGVRIPGQPVPGRGGAQKQGTEAPRGPAAQSGKQ
jgi:quercetin dioxygenase-like cupin family protein